MKLGQLYRCGHVVAILLALGLSACGPISALSTVRDATVALEAAKVAGADKSAPFEYTSAEQYLTKAREEQGYSDYQVAIELAKKALDYAVKARKLAMRKGEQPADSQVVPVPQPVPALEQPRPVPTRIAPRPVGGR